MTDRTLSVATHLAPSVLPLYAWVTDYIAARLGRAGRLVVADSYERCAADVDDLCFVCSVPYLLFAAEERIKMEVIALPVLRGERYGGRPVYFSDVIVDRESRYSSFDDLRGCRWAYNEPYSLSGYVVVLHDLLRRGHGRGFFGEMIEAGFHHEAIRMVADGTADAAAIDSQVLTIELRSRPDLAARLRVIDTIGPSTIQPVVASVSRLSAEERDNILRALLELADDPAAQPVLEAACVERFASARDRDFDDVRRMLGRVQAAQLVGPDWHARWAELAPPAA